MAENEWQRNAGISVGTADGFVQIRIGPERPSEKQPRIEFAFAPAEARAIADALHQAAEKAEKQLAAAKQ